MADINKLRKLLKETNKKLGLNAMRFGSDLLVRERQSTGIAEIDKFLGGGFPYGQFSVVWGETASGKTSLMYSTIAKAQKEGKVCYYIAMEASYDSKRAKLFGVNTDELVIGQFPTAEKALSIRLRKSCFSNAGSPSIRGSDT